MKKTVSIILALLIAFSIIIALKSASGLFGGFTGNAASGYDTIESCKREVIITEGSSKTFDFALNTYTFTLESLSDISATLTAGTAKYTLPIPSERTAINDKVSITLVSAAQKGSGKALLLVLNKEDDKCSCVGNDATIKLNKEAIVSDGVKNFKFVIKEFYYDPAYTGTLNAPNSYVIYNIGGYDTEKAFSQSEITVPELNSLSIKTKTISKDGTVVLMLDNSKNCKSELEEKELVPKEPEIENPVYPPIQLGSLSTLQLSHETSSTKTYLLAVPSNVNINIITPEGRFGMSGGKVNEELSAPAKPQKKTFWKCITGNY